MEGVIIRSKAQWIKEGKKGNKILLQSRKKTLYFEANVSADKPQIMKLQTLRRLVKRLRTFTSHYIPQEKIN